MITNICTTQEQSQRLLQCGVSADTADMSWRTIIEPMIRDIAQWETPLLLTMPYSSAKDIYSGDDVQPAWSLIALLGLIPHVIEVYDDGDYYFSLAQEFLASEDYHAAYKYCWADDDVLVGKRSSCPIEACVQLIEWLLKNNYKLNEI